MIKSDPWRQRQEIQPFRAGPSGTLKALLPALAAGLLLCCQSDLAGGTDDVENPALEAATLELAFTDAGGNAPASATHALFLGTQNPAREPGPLATESSGDGILKLEAEKLAAQATARDNLLKDTIAFNVLTAAGSHEILARGYRLVRAAPSQWRFERSLDGSVLRGDSQGSLSQQIVLLPAVTGYQGQVGAAGQELGLGTVFIAGSPYHAAVDAQGSFMIQRMAQGTYTLRAMDADGKTYLALDTLSTAEAFTGSDWSEAEIIWIH